MDDRELRAGVVELTKKLAIMYSRASRLVSQEVETRDPVAAIDNLKIITATANEMAGKALKAMSALIEKKQ